MDFSMDLLCDMERTVIKQYHLLNRHEHGGIAYPAVFVIKADGTIGYRSLDRTVNRVNLSEVIKYLEDLQENPDLAHRSESAKPFIIPGPKNLLQYGKNMLFRGTLDDWKHHISFPFNAVKGILRKNR